MQLLCKSAVQASKPAAQPATCIRLVLLSTPAQSMAHGQDTEDETEFAIVFAAMGVNMETAHFFKQVRPGPVLAC